MARIAGINIPPNKHTVIGLTYIYGIGPHFATQIIEKTGVSPDTRVHALTEEDVTKQADVVRIW